MKKGWKPIIDFCRHSLSVFGFYIFAVGSGGRSLSSLSGELGSNSPAPMRDVEAGLQDCWQLENINNFLLKNFSMYYFK